LKSVVFRLRQAIWILGVSHVGDLDIGLSHVDRVGTMIPAAEWPNGAASSLRQRYCEGPSVANRSTDRMGVGRGKGREVIQINPQTGVFFLPPFRPSRADDVPQPSPTLGGPSTTLEQLVSGPCVMDQLIAALASVLARVGWWTGDSCVRARQPFWSTQLSDADGWRTDCFIGPAGESAHSLGRVDPLSARPR